MSDSGPLDTDAAEERLDRLEADIEATRRKVEADFPEHDGEPRYEDSGSEPGDDQTIAP